METFEDWIKSDIKLTKSLADIEKTSTSTIEKAKMVFQLFRLSIWLLFYRRKRDLFLGTKLSNMKKIYTLWLFSCLLTLTSCKIQYNKKAYIEAYKLTATYSCLSEGMESKLYDSIVLKNDASFSYDVLAGPNNYKIDSVGRSQGKKIPRTPLKDLGNKKLIHKHCLQYYKSKELNKLAKKWWRENKL